MFNKSLCLVRRAGLSRQMTSVERVVDYAELKSEADWMSRKHPVPANWPSRGQLTFRHMNFSYSSGGTPVLRDINATFRPCEKVSPAESFSWTEGSDESVVVSSPRLSARSASLAEPALAKAPSSRLCSAWPNLRGRSTSTTFSPQRSASTTCVRRCPSSLRFVCSPRAAL